MHYDGDESYFFVNGRQELKFKVQLVKEKLCIGNLSDQWTVDYQEIVGVGPIRDMHRYLMTKHNIRQ